MLTTVAGMLVSGLAVVTLLASKLLIREEVVVGVTRADVVIVAND